MYLRPEGDGLEVACNEYEVSSVATIEQFVAGEQVELLLNDQFSDSAAKRQHDRLGESTRSWRDRVQVVE